MNGKNRREINKIQDYKYLPRIKTRSCDSCKQINKKIHLKAS